MPNNPSVFNALSLSIYVKLSCVTGYALLCQVTHGAIQFTVYEELREFAVYFKGKEGRTNHINGDKLLVL